MVLADSEILHAIRHGRLEIEPFDETNVEPASVDLRLGADATLVRELYTLDDETATVDTRQEHPRLLYEEIHSSDSFVIEPGEFILTTTQEHVTLPDDIVAHVLGRSSLGRLGISVHQTAGYIDPGFEGQITLELSNHGPAPVRLYYGDRICQIVFERVTGIVNEPYGHDGSQYQGQSGATPSGMHFE